MENRGDKGTISGALSIVSGALGIMYGILVAVFLVFFLRFFSNPSFYPGMRELPDYFFRIMVVFYSLIGFAIILVGVLAVIGGVFALKRKHWGLALAGSIAGALTFFPCGITGVIFVCLGKSEFDTGEPLSESGAMT